jgi:ABC-type uncharacterized transport system substrate-binding protein
MLKPALTALYLIPGAAAAHPHVFVEAGVELVMDGAGQLLGVRLTWTYDDFFSYLLTADLGIDPEGDLILTDAELATLQASVMDWPADFAGDLTVTQGGVVQALGPRLEPSVSLDQGRVVERHFRPLATPVAATTPVVVQVYDPYYYVAYTVVGDIILTDGAGCVSRYQPADLNTAYALVDELLYGRAASDVGPDEEFPEVGYAFADTVTVTCGG